MAKVPRFKIFISVIIIIVALLLLFNKLFTTQPIQITLESGQEITTSTAEYFSLTTVLVMVICAFLIGSASLYLFYNSDQAKPAVYPAVSGNGSAAAAEIYGAILPLLKSDEQQAVKILRDSGGELQQNALALKLGVSKVKATRILYSLEQKNLIIKERHGLTNMVKLKK